ncbi:recombinase family protein [Cryobacterium soli]|uniref:recombinase family protein n=1 Tax=Cryobacterium soli TaxID=2220095 RepID=UPI000E75CF8B|nr:recombinase family protein [Cryobacterium soli]
MNTRAAIYVRQSVNHKEGIERALARCTRLVEARGWSLVETFADNDVSASKSRTSSRWADLLRAVEAGRIDVVVGIDMDRLVRSIQDMGTLIDLGVRVLTVDGEIDLTTADGEFRATMLAGIARFEVRRKSERQKRANEYRTASGRPAPGRRRFGYEVDGIRPRAGEAEVVVRMFEHVANGGSIRSLARGLVADGVDPAPGLEWSNRRVRDILTNPHYAGRIKRLGGVLDSDVVIPVVDATLWADVNAILSDPSRKTTTGQAPRHIVSLIAHCGTCGDRLVYMRAYLCRSSASHVSIRKPILEPVVVEAVATAFLTTPLDSFGTPGSTSVGHLMAQHRKIEASAADVLADRDEGLVSSSVARARLVDLRDERLKIEAELERARTEKTASATLSEIAHDLVGDSREWTMGEFAAMVQTVGERFTALDMDRQRDVVRALLHVEVASGRTIDRVHIWHKIATHLNPESEPVVDYDAADEDLNRSAIARRARRL